MPGAGAYARPEGPGRARWTAKLLRVSDMNPKFSELFDSKLSASKCCLLMLFITQSCPALCDHWDYSLPGSSVL